MIIKKIIYFIYHFWSDESLEEEKSEFYISGEVKVSIQIFTLLLADWQTDAQNIYRIDTHIWEECDRKKHVIN